MQKPPIDTLQKQTLRLCEDNIFLEEDDRNYIKKQIPQLPVEALKYLMKIFTDFEKNFRKLLKKSLSKDPEKKHWQKFIQFKKSQLSKLSQCQSRHDYNTADAVLDTELKNL